MTRFEDKNRLQEAERCTCCHKLIYYDWDLFQVKGRTRCRRCAKTK